MTSLLIARQVVNTTHLFRNKRFHAKSEQSKTESNYIDFVLQNLYQIRSLIKIEVPTKTFTKIHVVDKINFFVF